MAFAVLLELCILKFLSVSQNISQINARYGRHSRSLEAKSRTMS